MLKRWFVAAASAVPPLLVVAVIAVIAYGGHATEWKAPKFDDLSDSVVGLMTTGAWKPPKPAGGADEKEKSAEKPAENAAKEPDWCPEHGMPRSICTTCNKDNKE